MSNFKRPPVIVPGGWHCRNLPTGEYAVLVPHQHVLTHLGPIAFESAARQPLFLDLTANPFKMAGQSWLAGDDRVVEYDGQWSIQTVARGVSPFIYDLTGSLRFPTPQTGSQGYRYVEHNTTPAGRLVTGDETYGPANGHDLNEWTALPCGLVIGQRGAANDEIQVWDGQVHRSFVAGQCRFSHATEGLVDGEVTIAHSTYRLTDDGAAVRDAVLTWATEAELRALPEWVPPSPPPPPPPKPKEPPVPVSELAITITEYTTGGVEPCLVTAAFEVTGATKPVNVALTVNDVPVAASTALTGTLTTTITKAGTYRLGASVSSGGVTAKTGMVRLVTVTPKPPSPTGDVLDLPLDALFADTTAPAWTQRFTEVVAAIRSWISRATGEGQMSDAQFADAMYLVQVEASRWETLRAALANAWPAGAPPALLPPGGMTRLQAEALVVPAYRELLFRDPDPFGLDYYGSRLRDGRMTDATMRADIMASAEYKSKHPTPFPIPPGGATPDMHAWPKFGGSYNAGMTNPACDPGLFASLNRDAGGNFTRVNTIDAWAVGPNGTGQYSGFMPWERDAAGVFDLEKPNPKWDERLNSYVRAQNAAGTTVQLTVFDLYSWSERKQGLLWVPDQNLGPFRRNRNGVRWGNPDDPTFLALPDWVMLQHIQRMCAAVKGLAVCFETGNEMPEKDMHIRIAQALRGHFTADWRPDITTNRQEDTSGQYFNMKVGTNFDRIAFHGKDSLAYLDEEFPDEPSSRPRTFRDLWDKSWPEGKADPKRIIMSSDGCRSNNTMDCYDWPTLAAVARDHIRRGFTFEHQSRVKMQPFLEGMLDLTKYFEGDWLRSLRT